MTRVIAIIIWIGTTATVSAQTIEFEELFTLGLDESLSSEYLFARPVEALIDREGRLFISDESSMDVRRFSAEGLFEHSYGRRGRAPGEFQSISSITVRDNGNLLVFDGQLSRSTQFSFSGVPIQDARIDRFQLLRPRKAAFNPDGSELIALSKMPVHGNRSREDAASVFHVYDSEGRFESKKQAFGKFDQLTSNADDVFVASISRSHPGSFAYASSDRILYAPGMYSGTLFEFGRHDEGVWQLTAEVQSGLVYPAATHLMEPSSAPVPGLIVVRSVTQDDPLKGQVNVQSAGLHVLSSGSIIHFVLQSDDEGSELRYEFYDNEMRLVESGLVKSFPVRNWYSRPIYNVTGSNAHGVFAAVNLTSAYPSVAVFQILENR